MTLAEPPELRPNRAGAKPRRPADKEAEPFSVIPILEARSHARAPVSDEEAREAALPGRWRFRSVQVCLGFFMFLFGMFAEEATRRVPILGRLRKQGDKSAVRFRDLLEDLGGGFIKFGQCLSMRSDILPPAYCLALSRLFDKVPPFPTWIAKRIVERELGAPLSELFEDFGEEPVGAASFGQVHLVTLKGGEDAGRRAVVKICRPNSEVTMQTDAKLLLALGWFVDFIGLLGRIEISPILRDAVKWTRKEIVYLQEAKNADHLHELTHWNPRQRIPYVYWALTTNSVLTMEYIEGPTISEVIRRFEAGDETVDEELAEMSCDRATLARNIWQTFVLSAFVGRAFHGDPHPGNIIVLPENTVGFVDIGLLGRLNEEARREQAISLDAIAQENIERLFVSVLDILDAPRGLLVTDTYDQFHDEVDSWLDACDNAAVPFAEKTMQRLVNGSMHIARQIGLVLPAQTILFYKAFLTIDAVVLRLWPEFDYKRESRRALRLVRMYELEKAYAPGQVLDASLLLQMLVSQLPSFVSGRLQDFEQGQRQIYRKLNLLPVVTARVLKTVSQGLVLLGVVAWVEGAGYLGAIWKYVPREAAPILEYTRAHLVAVGLVAAVAFWAAHVLKARSFVKVQKD